MESTTERIVTIDIRIKTVTTKVTDFNIVSETRNNNTIVPQAPGIYLHLEDKSIDYPFCSDRNIILELFGCSELSEMIGKEIKIVLSQTPRSGKSWKEMDSAGWELEGFGSVNSDKFIAYCYDNEIITESELKYFIIKKSFE